MPDARPRRRTTTARPAARGRPADAGLRRGPCVLRQPRHVGDAPRRRAGPRPRDPRGARTVRGRGDRRSRRLRADGRGTRGDPPALSGRGWATAWPTSTTPIGRAPPVVNVVGDHARGHLQHDAPLTSDAEGIARGRSPPGCARAPAPARPRPTRRRPSARPPHTPATSPRCSCPPMSRGARPRGRSRRRSRPRRRSPPRPPSPTPRRRWATLARPRSCSAGSPRASGPLRLAARIAQAVGARLLLDTFVPRVRRGTGLPAPEKVPYFAEPAIEMLGEIDELVVVATRPPVAFFAYPDVPSVLVPEGTACRTLATPAEDAEAALAALAAALGVDPEGDEPTAGDGPPAGATDRRDTADGAPTDDDAALDGRRPRSGPRARDPGRGDRRRRSPHPPRSLCGRRRERAAPARVAAAHGRGHRPRAAGSHRRRGRLSRPAGARAPGRRLGDVHAAGAVDPGARGASTSRR